MNTIAKNRLKHTFEGSRQNLAIASALVVVVIGTGYVLVATHAATFFASVNPSQGTATTNAKIITDSTALGGKSVQFNAPVATPPPTPPPSSSFPSASSTGSTTACSSLAASGSITASTAGQTISGKNITGNLTISASNVTISNVCIHGNAHGVIHVSSSATGVIVKDVTIAGDGSADATGGRDGVWDEGKSTQILRANISAVENGIHTGGSGTLIQDSYIHDMLNKRSDGALPHYDGIENDGGTSNLTFRHNTISNNLGQTSAIMNDNYYGSISGLTIDNNMLTGGDFSLYLDGHFNSNKISGVVITNNHFSTSGVTVGTNETNNSLNTVTVTTWSGNVDQNGGAVNQHLGTS